MTHVRITAGAGVMACRVVDGKVTDISTINADGREATGYYF
jgi:hypothetical protein